MESSDNSLPLESPHARTDSDLDSRSGAYFPRRLLTEFFDFIADPASGIQAITYADFAWRETDDFNAGYPAEWRAWQGELKDGTRDPDKAYLVLQYDVDSRPERTLGLLREPSHQRVPANIMIFNKRVDRRHLKNTGELRFTEYDLDDRLFHDLEKRGFVIGYHTNAYEQSVFAVDEALKVFDRDVRELQKRFNIEFFSAHGGVAGPDGKNNNGIPFHPDWTTRLKWVHNGCSPKFDGQFSDGGHNSPKRDPQGRDLREFVKGFRPGKRYRLLVHPQYYDTEYRRSPRFAGTPWYDEMLERSEAGKSLWDAEVERDSKMKTRSPLLRWFARS